VLRGKIRAAKTPGKTRPAAALVEQGRAALKDGRAKEAEAAATQALASEDSNVDALTLRGQARLAQGDKRGR